MGSPRVMLVRRKVVSPKRGSLCFISTTICSSGEYHRSCVISRGNSLSNSPAGMVTVMRVPSAMKPSICCVSRRSFFGPGRGGAASPSARRLCAVLVGISTPKEDSFPTARRRASASPGGVGVLRRVPRAVSTRYSTCATGSLMMMRRGSWPSGAVTPPRVSACSRRVRPAVSRKSFAADFRTMRLPSASLCTCSVTDSAANGAPCTTLRPKVASGVVKPSVLNRLSARPSASGTGVSATGGIGSSTRVVLERARPGGGGVVVCAPASASPADADNNTHAAARPNVRLSLSLFIARYFLSTAMRGLTFNSYAFRSNPQPPMRLIVRAGCSKEMSLM